MVSVMDIEPSKAQIMDNSKGICAATTTTVANVSAVVPPSSGGGVGGDIDDQKVIDKNLAKKTMKLDLNSGYNMNSKNNKDNSNSSKENSDNSGGGGDGKKSIKSPKSPLNNSGARIVAQSSITSQIEVVEDRKALRDALYQGIFHRHRRTIFAFGSFLRMLRSRNSQYNTIRSSSEGEDDGR